MPQSLAVLVDGDNISGRHGPRIVEIAGQHGNPVVVRVYTDARRSSDWHEALGYEMIHAGTGKNAADLLLAIDAMELAFSHGIDRFVVASSDGDFSHLAHRLRKLGATVTGVGEEKAPLSVRHACTSFVEIAAPQPPKLVPIPGPGITDLDIRIRAMIAGNSKKGAGMRIAALGPKMHARHGTLISSYPERSWRAYLAARPTIYDLDPRGPDAMVRFRSKAFSASA